MKIPVEFEYKGKVFNGYLSSVNGAGGNHFHLMVNQHYWGQLSYTGKEWQFSNQEGWEPSLALYFEAVLISWYQ